MPKTTDPTKSEDELPPTEFKLMEKKDVPLCVLFGDTPVSRVANFFIGLPFFSYNISKVAELNEISRQTASKSIKTLLRFRMIKEVKNGKVMEYQWDTDSKQAKGMQTLLSSVIEVIVDEQLEYIKTHAPPPVFEVTEHDMRLILRGDYKGKLPEGHLLKIKRPEP